MRITGGKARSIALRTDKNSSTRPATDRLRESLFSSLGGVVIGKRFFDFFAGTGSYGLEAWSRGATGGIFVEKNRTLAKNLRENISAVGRSLGATAPAPVEAVIGDVMKWRPPEGDRASLVFVDPPYAIIAESAASLFPQFEEWLEPGGVIVFEMPGEMELDPPGWQCLRRIGKGRGQPTCCLFVRAD